MAAPTIHRRVLAQVVAQRCTQVTNATGYYGSISPSTGLTPDATPPADPPAKPDGSRRVQPYFVLFPGAGGTPFDDTERSIGAHHDPFVDLEFPIAITVAGGDPDDVLALVDRLEALLYGWSPGWVSQSDSWDPEDDTEPRIHVGPLRRPPGYQAPLLTDKQFTPHRFYVPLQYRTTAHT